MGRKVFIAIAILALWVLIAISAFYLLQPEENVPGPVTQATLTAPPKPGAPVFGTNYYGKPKPIVDYFKGCPPSGDGGDPVLNTLKNRIDEATWEPISAHTLVSLTWPSDINSKPRSSWSTEDKEEVALYEGTPVQIEGYLISAKKQGPETTNCRSVQDVDYHIWLADDPNKGRESSIVVETTPRVRAVHPQWTITSINNIVKNHQRVRISGWVMMDPEHPDQVGKTRGTIWEIHPIMQIETMQNGQWKPLDNGTTGINQPPVNTGDTALDITPVPTATTPPASDTSVQDNKLVQITDIFYDGQGRNEPDEYVEITNTGTQPVDITDWELEDTTGQTEYRWESYAMQPGEAIRVYTNKTDLAPGEFSFLSGRAIWNNSGDVAVLYDADKQLVSRYAYGNKK